jgi:L-histidine N-alpha-methyltransferase
MKALSFLSHLHRIIHPQDRLLIGFDLKKSPEVILKAYNDKYGLTRDFNLNYLKRLNEELGANFNLDNFEHAPLYDPQNGVAKSYLVSTCEQTVVFSALNRAIRFSKWETIYTEQSQKYDTEMIHNLAELSGFEVEKNFTDTQSYFMNSLWKPKQ